MVDCQGMTRTPSPSSRHTAKSLPRQCEEAKYLAFIEAARKHWEVGEGVIGSVHVKLQRIDGSDPWTILELGDTHDNDSKREEGRTDADLMALLHTPNDATRG
jgi:hypothetical protein